jgi:hypothetical protein
MKISPWMQAVAEEEAAGVSYHAAPVADRLLFPLQSM